MLTTRNKILTGSMVLLAMTAMTIGGCKKDSPAKPTSVTYQLKTKDQLGVSGTATFTQTSSTVTTIDIVLTGGDAVSHPAHIHSNSAIEGGAIAISLNPVVGGKSSTQVTTLDNGGAINYAQLIAYDGYINVHESSTDLVTLLAQGDIGGNVLTSTSISYHLDSVGAFGVSGTALFEKRTNGNTLVTVSLVGTLSSGTYPAAIHLGSIATVGGGPVTKGLTDVDGASGKSYTNIRTLDSGTPISYDELLVYDGYIAIMQSATIQTVVCQGNFGAH